MTPFQIEFSTIVFFLIVHFLADFALQTPKQAINKSTSNKYLFYHVSTYSLSWLLAMYAYTDIFTLSVCFTLITFVTHFLTDYVTSRMAKVFFDAEDYHNGFVVVGFDQVLHYIQLILTYMLLSDMDYFYDLP